MNLVLKGFLLALSFALVSTLLPASAHAEGPKRYKRSVESYKAPDVVLVNQDGEKVRLQELLSAGKPVMLDFIYGTCTTICPVLSAGFSNMQRKLGAEAADKLQLVSVTIDPEYDTPEIMTDYLKRYRAKPGWDFLTGSREDIDKVMHAFDAYVPNKMSHYPVTLLKGPGNDSWIRIYGLISTKDLMNEFQNL